MSHDLTSTQGKRVYKRTIAYLLAVAAQKCQVGTISIMESIGSSLHFKIAGVEEAISESIVEKLAAEMNTLIAERRPIVRRALPRSDAVLYFTKHSATQTLELLNSQCDSHVDCYCCDLGSGEVFMTLAHGYDSILSNTELIAPEHFSVEFLRIPFPHFRLYHAVVSSPIEGRTWSLKKSEEIMLMEAYATRKRWGERQCLETVSQINTAIATSRVKSIVQVSEALHDFQVCSIASKIAGEGHDTGSIHARPRLVLIAGPSSSGKTTFAKRLCVSLETLGVRPVVISVDSYYKAWQDIDDRGMQYVDWEALRSLNLDLLNEHLIDLLAGKEVLIPEYDMRTSMPMTKDHWIKMRLPEGGTIIMEGIHCLNPELTPRVAREDKFQIMISPLSALAIDDVTFLSSTQVRMLRRMVRDYLFRGRSALSTLKQWPGVALGERVNIYPNQNFADVVMNSGLTYEVHVLKVFAEPLLKTISPDLPEYAEARRLISMLDRVVSMPAQVVPPQSLLREFVGGSWYYDFAGYYQTA